MEDIEALCLDAGIVLGQEALPPVDVYAEKMSGVALDDRAIRDAFFRFFCRVLSGYENYLRFPDANFLVSGEEWFDTQGFVSAASPSLQGFLGSLVTTQLFQSFVQRRTESSDFRCMLLDECITVYQRDGGKKFGRKACSHKE
ncbi:MAG: DENN domain-containing protein, partial [bacterium]